MATYSYLSPSGGWEQFDDAADQQRLSPNGGWMQVNGAASAPTGYIKVFNGTIWEKKPVKVWNGSSWVIKPIKFWNGSSWITTN